MNPRPLALLATSLLLPGCVLDAVHDDEGARVEGIADGYTPMSQSLRVYVETGPESLQAAEFHRDEWYLYGLEEELRERRDVIFQGTSEGVTRDLIVHQVPYPGEFEDYRWSNRPESLSEQREMDSAWDDRLRELGGEGFYLPTAPSPTQLTNR